MTRNTISPQSFTHRAGACLAMIIMLLMLVPTGVRAAGNQYFWNGDICYAVLEGTNNVTVTGCDYGTTVLDIPSTVEYEGTTYTVTEVGDRKFEFDKDITTIKIPRTVTKIGESAFYMVYNLEKVEIAEGSQLKELGVGAFCWNERLKSINLPEGLETIGVAAFSGCGLSQVTLPSTLLYIGDAAFQRSYYLRVIKCLGKQPAKLINEDGESAENYSEGLLSRWEYKGVRLEVPEGARDAYDADQWWTMFYNMTGGGSHTEAQSGKYLVYDGDDIDMKAPYDTYTARNLWYRRDCSSYQDFDTFCLPFDYIYATNFENLYLPTGDACYDETTGQLTIEFYSVDKYSFVTIPAGTPFLTQQHGYDYVLMNNNSNVAITADSYANPAPMQLNVYTKGDADKKPRTDMQAQWGGTLRATHLSDACTIDDEGNVKPVDTSWAYRAYMRWTGDKASVARISYSLDGTKPTTGIGRITKGQTADPSTPVYTIGGQQVGTHGNLGSLPHGVYVVKGKKVKR